MEKRSYGGVVTRQCERCGRDVTRKASAFKAHTFCSRECYFASEVRAEAAREVNRARYPDGAKRSLTCLMCGARVDRHPSQMGKRTFCSRTCKSAYPIAHPRRKVNRGGYVKVWVGRGAPGADAHGNLLEHRKVVQDRLGRPLLPDENVHHINGVRDDNRIENLELWSMSQPSGQRVEDKLRWAREFIARYEGVPV